MSNKVDIEDLKEVIASCKAPLALQSTDGSRHIASPNGKVLVDTSQHGDVTITTLGADGKSTGHLTATYQNGVSGSDRSFKPDPELADRIRIAAAGAKACGKFDMAEEVVRSEVGQKTKSVVQER